MKTLRALLVLGLIGWMGPVYALTDTTSVAVTVDIPLRAEIATQLGTTSGCAQADVLSFSTPDDLDMPGGNPFHYYAPLRSAGPVNCHEVKLLSTGASMTLSADVTGQAGAKPLSDKLSIFFGGLFGSDGSDSGGKSGDWENADSFSRTLNKPFAGIGTANYRFAGDESAAGTYNGTVTWTLVSN